MKCPICTVKRVTSTHHINPRDDGGDDGGSDNHKSKIMLCRPCYDIVEEIYNSTGAELSPQVIELIKLEHGFPVGNTDRDIARAILSTSLHRLHRKYKPTKGKNDKAPTPDGIPLKCSHCGKWHYPGKNGRVICPVLKNMTAQVRETETFCSMLMEKIKIKMVRASIE